MLTVRVFDDANWLEQLRSSWAALHAEASGSPFQHPAWIGVWWSVFGAGRSPRTIVLYEGRDLVGLFPLAVTRGPLRRLVPMGMGPSDTLAPLVLPEHRCEGATTILQTLRDLQSLDAVVLPELPESSALAALLEGGRAQSVCLKLDLPSAFDAYVRSLSKSLRYDVRRLEKQAGRFRIEFARPSEASEALASLLDLHGRRWRRRGLPGAFFGRTVKFQRSFAPDAIAEGRLWLPRIWVDGTLAGALYALRAGRTVAFYQSGFEPGLASLSPGTLLVAATIRRAIEEGCVEFDLLRGDEPYKRRWGPQRCEPNLRFAWPMPGLRGRIAHTFGEAGYRAEDGLKRRFEGRGLLR